MLLPYERSELVWSVLAQATVANKPGHRPVTGESAL
jgi:hypothetical protein